MPPPVKPFDPESNGPELENSSTLLSYLSATQRLLLASIASPVG